MTTPATRPIPARPAVSKHTLTMLPAAPVAPPQPSPPIPLPVAVPAQDVAPKAESPGPWAPIPCHTILPAKRLRFF